MTRQESIELMRRVLGHVEVDRLDLAGQSWREPRESYVGQDRLAADIEMFRRVPHVIGWTGEVRGPGDFTTKDVMGVPVLVVRGKDATLRAFVNGCAHRGAQVATSCGNTRRFTCPYHGWTYGLDGRVAGVPDRPMFADADLKNRRLLELPVSERGGLISVGLSPEVEVGDYLAELDRWLLANDFAHRAHFQTRRFDVAANWKLAVIINFEGYHFPYLHSTTLSPMVTNHSVFDFFGRHARWAFPFRDIEKHAEMDESAWPDQFFGTVVYALFPSVVLIEAPGSTQMLRIYPGRSPGECVIYNDYGSVTPITSDQEREWLTFGFDGSCSVLRDEDFPAAEACQRGFESGVDHALFGRNEAVLHHLARVWEEALTPGGR